MAKRPRQSLRSGSVEKLTQSDFAVELTPQAMNAQYRGKRMAAYLEEVIVATYLWWPVISPNTLQIADSVSLTGDLKSFLVCTLFPAAVTPSGRVLRWG